MSHPRPTNEPDRPPYAQSARATRRKAALCARATRQTVSESLRSVQAALCVRTARRRVGLCARTFVALVLAVSLLPLDVSFVSAYGSGELAATASGQEVSASSASDPAAPGADASADPADPVSPAPASDPSAPAVPDPAAPTAPADPVSPDPATPAAPIDPTAPAPGGPILLDTPGLTPESNTQAPAITTPNDDPLPQATVGKAYWNIEGNKPLVKFEATGTPAPLFKLKDRPATPGNGSAPDLAKREEDEFGDVHWTGAGLPDGLMLNESTGEITGEPSAGQADYECEHTFTVVASNGTAPDSERAFRMTVVDESKKVIGEYVSVPAVTGVSQSTAVRRLARAGLVANVVRQVSEEPAGEVIGQDPPFGAQVEKGSTVTLIVSSGPEGPEAPAQVVSLDLYAYLTDAAGSFIARMGENGREWSEGAWWVPVSLSEKGQRIRLCAAVQMDDGRAYYQNEGDWPGEVSLRWETSNPEVVVVTSTGVVVATGDGQATVTAVAPNGKMSSIKLRVVGQSARFPVEVQVIDSFGSAYFDERITFSKLDSSWVQLFARVVFNDLSTASNCPAAEDYDPGNETIKTLSWYTSNTDKAYINASTGLLVPRSFGTLKAYAQVSGGDPLFNNGIVSGYVWTVIDSGDYRRYDPSSSLNVRVVYQEDEDFTATQRVFSVDELRAVESAYETYTLTSDTGYVTSSACGIYLKTLFGLVEADVDDVYGIRLAANDGVNPGLITGSFLFQPRYYLPNIEFGGNTVGARLVYPMLAYENNWRDSAKNSTDSREDYSTLDGATCFQLMFGSVGMADGTKSKSLKWVNSITIILKGAPPASPKETPDPGGGGSSGENGVAGDGLGSGTAEGAGTASTALGQMTSQVSGGSSVAGMAGNASGASSHVYQMISKAETQLQLEDWSNPYARWAAPLVGLCAVLGGLKMLVWYRRQRNRPLRPGTAT